jgi:uncharacterized membrane protein
LFRRHTSRAQHYFRGLHCENALMIQRKQSLFLLIAALACGLTWLFPIGQVQQGEQVLRLMTHGVLDAEEVTVEEIGLPVPFHIVQSIVGVVFLSAILLFRDRKRQLRVVRGAWLMALAVGVLQFISMRSLQAYLAQFGETSTTVGASLLLPLLAIVMGWLAERGIRQDEALVRSMDRLR